MKKIKWGSLVAGVGLVLGGLFVGAKALNNNAEEPEETCGVPEEEAYEVETLDDMERILEEEN